MIQVEVLQALNTIYTIDPEVIIIGGGVIESANLS